MEKLNNIMLVIISATEIIKAFNITAAIKIKLKS